MVFLQYPPIGFWLVVPVCFTAASALQPPSTRSRMVARSSEPRHSDATFQRPTSRFFFREAAAATEATSPPCSSLGIEDETPPKNMRWWVHSAVLRIFFCTRINSTSYAAFLLPLQNLYQIITVQICYWMSFEMRMRLICKFELLATLL